MKSLATRTLEIAKEDADGKLDLKQPTERMWIRACAVWFLTNDSPLLRLITETAFSHLGFNYEKVLAQLRQTYGNVSDAQLLMFANDITKAEWYRKKLARRKGQAGKEEKPVRRLSSETIKKIRSMKNLGIPRLQALFNVSPSHLWKILNNGVWK